MSDVLNMGDVLKNLGDYLDPEAKKISSSWKTVVTKVKPYKTDDCEIPFGERLAQNTHVVEIKKGILLIEVTHSGWIQYLRMYQKFILKGLSMECPELKIRNLAFRTRGSDVNLFDGYDEQLQTAKTQRLQEIEQNEKELQDFNRENDQNLQNNSSQEINPGLKDQIAALYKALEDSEDKK